MKIPSGYREPLPVKSLVEGVYKCHENGLRLVQEAEALYGEQFFLGCINACRLAFEEFAKAHLLTQGAAFAPDEEERWAWLWKSFEDHREKLRILEYELHWPSYQNKQKFHDHVKLMKDLREESLYVQFDARTKTFLLPEEVLSSRGGAKKQAERQLQYLHLLVQILFPAGRLSVKTLTKMFKRYRAEGIERVRSTTKDRTEK